jgi:hypothetical protein
MRELSRPRKRREDIINTDSRIRFVRRGDE